MKQKTPLHKKTGIVQINGNELNNLIMAIYQDYWELRGSKQSKKSIKEILTRYVGSIDKLFN